jgi:hypothetical protein
MPRGRIICVAIRLDLDVAENFANFCAIFVSSQNCCRQILIDSNACRSSNFITTHLAQNRRTSR